MMACAARHAKKQSKTCEVFRGPTKGRQPCQGVWQIWEKRLAEFMPAPAFVRRARIIAQQAVLSATERNYREKESDAQKGEVE